LLEASYSGTSLLKDANKNTALSPKSFSGTPSRNTAEIRHFSRPLRRKHEETILPQTRERKPPPPLSRNITVKTPVQKGFFRYFPENPGNILFFITPRRACSRTSDTTMKQPNHERRALRLAFHGGITKPHLTLFLPVHHNPLDHRGHHAGGVG
jgi:hypothetical protein